MKKVFYSDIAAIPADVCPSSLDENLEPIDPSNTSHRWDDTTDPITCAECGTEKKVCSDCHGTGMVRLDEMRDTDCPSCDV